MQALQSYGQAEPTYDNKAYTFSSTYHDGTLKVYSHHPTQPSHAGGVPQYHMSQLNSYALTGDTNTFRKGISAFRNARDLTTEQRDMLVDQANAVARTQLVDAMSFDGLADTTSFNESISQDTVTSLGKRLVDSETSADELVFDYSTAKSRTKRQKKAGEPRQTSEPTTVPIEVQTEQTVYRSASGRQLLLNGQKIFVPDHCWEPSLRNGKRGLYNREKNIFTFIEIKESRPTREGLRSKGEEPSSIREYFLPSEGISENVMKKNIARYCGGDAEVATTLSRVCRKDSFLSIRKS